MRKFFLSIIFLILTIASYSQNMLDSLESLLDRDTVGNNYSHRLEILEKLYYYTFKSQPQRASEYIARATYICDSVLHDTLQAIVWKQRLADIYFSQNVLDQAVRLYTEIKNFYRDMGDSVKYAYILVNLGKIYAAMDVSEIAVQDFDEAKHIFKRYGDTTGYIMAQNNIALVFYNNYKIQEAFQILNKNLNLVENIANNEIKALVNKYLAIIYNEELDIDSALYFYLEAVKYYKLADKEIEIAEIYLEIGKMYEEDETDLSEGLKFFQKSESTFTKYKAEHRLSEVYLYYAKIYEKQKKYGMAEDYLRKAFNYAMQYDLSEIRQEIYREFANIYTQQKKYKLANEYLQAYIDEINSYFAKEKEQGFAQVILLFQNQEKQKEIELLEKKEALKNQQLKNKQQLIYASAIVIILLAVFVAFFFYTSRRQRQINRLLQEQNRKINLQKKEIETQSRILEKATMDLLKQKQEIEIKNQKITASITYASRIQKAMLPSENNFKKYFEDYFIFYKPKETVSGDFYWLSEIKTSKPRLFKTEDTKQGKIILAVVDCTGHGVPGAFMAMLGDAYLNQIIKIQNIIEPDEILAHLHKVIRETLQQDETDNNDGMDMALIVIDKNEKTMKFSGAKNPLVYIQNGKMYRVHGDLMSIGGMQKEKERVFVKHTIDITAPTWVYMYTDGFQDQFGGKYGRKYMAKRFRDFLYSIYQKPFAEQRKLLAKELKQWKGKKYPQMDDITVIGIKL